MPRTGSVVMPGVTSTHCQAAITVKIIDKRQPMSIAATEPTLQSRHSTEAETGRLFERDNCKNIRYARIVLLREGLPPL
jgi:hypothetical protein